MAEAEAAVSVNEKKWLVMHMHVQLKLDEQSCECSVQTLVGYRDCWHPDVAAVLPHSGLDLPI
jgi:hypothetical protein